MIQKLKLLILSAVALFAFMPAVAYAQNIGNNLCQGAEINLDSSNSATCPTNGASTLSDKIRTFINVFSAIVGAVAVIMLIIGGFRYIVSGGRQESVTGAKNTIIYALVGLIIVALAQIVVRFVLSKTA